MPAIDQITTEIIGHRLRAASDEMMAALVKTSYSPNIKERRDCSVGVFDAKGSLLALTAISPGHLSSLMGMVDNIIRRHPIDKLKPGDAFLTNDPYVGGGSHLPDYTVTSPVFVGGDLVGFVSNIAHHSDVGGKVAGSESADCTSIYQEGLRVPPVRLMDGACLKGDILDVVLLNSRTPWEREGDINAQLATNAIGVRRFQDLYARFGAETARAGSAAFLDYSETRTRAGIAGLPDGTFENEGFIDNDGIESRLVKLKVTIEVEGDRIHFDFAGSDPQTGGARNMPFLMTLCCVYYAVKAIIDPEIPPNAGYFRAVSVGAPPGLVVNATPPAAVGDRSASANIMGDVLMGAFAKAVPERVLAGCGPLHGLIFSGYDPRGGRYFVDYETYAGAGGALLDDDGKDAIRVHTSGSANLPIESVEQEFPLTVERYELIADTGGAGRFRGGLGTRRDVTIWAKEARLAGRGLRQRVAAPGLFGGLDGATGRFVLKPGRTEETVLASAFSELAIEPGTTVRVETPSGAGYGDPMMRAPAKVEVDVTSGKVTEAAAEAHYGVVVRNGRLDLARTEALRRERPGSGRRPVAKPGKARKPTRSHRKGETTS